MDELEGYPDRWMGEEVARMSETIEIINSQTTQPLSPAPSACSLTSPLTAIETLQVMLRHLRACLAAEKEKSAQQAGAIEVLTKALQLADAALEDEHYSRFGNIRRAIGVALEVKL